LFGDKGMWKIDTTQTGIPSIFRLYEWIALEHIYKMRKGITSKTTFDYLETRKKISRASIIGLLKRLNKVGVLGYDEVSGKGGFHREYFVSVEREDIPRKIALDAIKTIRTVFPEDPFLMDVQSTTQNILPISDKPR